MFSLHGEVKAVEWGGDSVRIVYADGNTASLDREALRMVMTVARASEIKDEARRQVDAHERQAAWMARAL